jgi:hypothetical protein
MLSAKELQLLPVWRVWGSPRLAEEESTSSWARSIPACGSCISAEKIAGSRRSRRMRSHPSPFIGQRKKPKFKDWGSLRARLRSCIPHGPPSVLDRATIRIAAISAAAAEAVGEGWQDVRIASSPNDAELLALAARLCET